MNDPKNMPIPSETGNRQETAPYPDAGEREIALCRSILYEALALGFRPPTPETLDRLIAPETNGALASAARLLDSGKQSPLEARVRELAGTGPTLENLEDTYIRLFGHSLRGIVSLYGTEYGRGGLFQQPQELADLSGFLRAFGLVQREEARERIDHVSSECEFLLFLARKEAYAQESSDREMSDVTNKATRSFLKDHLARSGPALGRRLAGEDPGGFFGSLGNFLDAFLRSECERFGIAPGSTTLPLREVSEDDVPIACGSCAEGEDLIPPPTVRNKN